MFHRFQTQEERRQFGGSAFVEIQFCRLPRGSSLCRLVAVGSIRNWQNDSLYVHDSDLSRFDTAYADFFDCAVYNNRKSGGMDLYGINYYKPELVELLAAKIRQKRPPDYEMLLDWLQADVVQSRQACFVRCCLYILGI